jgi:hypothetical protein
VGASVDVGVGGTGVLVGEALGTRVGVAVDVGSGVGEEAGTLVSAGKGLDVAVAVGVGVCRTGGAAGVLAGSLTPPWSNCNRAQNTRITAHSSTSNVSL